MISRRAALAGMAAGLAAGCARPRGDRALSFWAMSYEGDYAPHLMTAFTARTGIEVDTQSLPWTAAHEKLLTASAGGSLPDVMMLPNGWVGEFAMIGAIAPVTDPALLADLFPGTRAATRRDGRDYAVPWSLAPQMQFFRRDILADAGYDAPPADWSGWREMGHRIKRRRPDDYAFLMLLSWWDSLFTFAGQIGAMPLRDGATRGNFRTPEFRAALAFYVSLYAEGLAPRLLSTGMQDPLAAFAQGFFAIYPGPPTLLLDLHRRRAEIPAELWGVARMPGPHGHAGATSTSASLCVSAGTRRPAAAWALVHHLTSAASELRLQRLIGNLPARRSAWAAPQLATPLLRPFAEQIAAPAAAPNIVEWERIRLDVQLVAERVVRGLMPIDAALAEMDRRVDQILAKRRALVRAGMRA